MRNLKRALSLTLASVMMLGMMVVGSSAAQGFPDVDDEDNVEAIEVAQAIGVMIGDENGNFRPESPVSRAEMATVMARLLNLDYDYYVSSCPFYDVSGVYDWARGPVGACYANKIVSGRGEGVYDPGATVTAVEASAMMMRALGYFQYSNDYADGFELATVRQGTAIGIYDQVGSSATEPMTRNQVAQMVLNALQCGTVKPDGNTINLTTPDGSVLTGKVNYTYVTDGKPFATAIGQTQATSIGSTNTGVIVELGEQLYNGDLRLKADDEDVFGRPARTWEYKGKAIGTYVKVELLRQEWSVKVTGKDLYDLLTKNTIDNYTFKITVDGVERNDASAKTMLDKAWFDEDSMFRANDKGVGETGKGVLTQVFVDTNKKLVYISVINTYLAKAAENYDEKDEDVTLNVYKLDNKGTTSRPVYVKTNTDSPEPIVVSQEDFDVSGVKKDDFFLVQVADAAIQTMGKPEVIDKTVISAFSKGNWVNNGTKYDYASTAKYDVDVLDQYDVKNMKNLTYNIFLDQYGYLIGLERNEDPDEYVFLTGINTGTLNTAVTTADANVIHLDGTMKNVKVNMQDSYLPCTETATKTRNLSQMNTWCKYTTDTNGVYTLTEIQTSTDKNEAKEAGGKAVAQYAQDVAVYHDANVATKTISQRYWSLNASGTTAMGVSPSDITYVYGNENSVYINVSLKKVDVDDTYISSKCWIINDVDAVVTDVANVSTLVSNLRSTVDGYLNPVAEIYTLYNEKNVIIAAITIGEDDGSNVRYVTPVKDTLEEEDYGHGDSARVVDGKWTWHRKVVTLDGTVETITETGDTLKYIGWDSATKKGMQKGQWYEIRLNADGDVRRSDKVTFNIAGDKYANGLEDANDMAPVHDTVVMYENGANMTGLKLEKNGMLYAERPGQTTQETRRGIYIDEDTKVVLITADDSKTMANQWTGTGRSGLETALTRMNAKSGSFGKGTVELSAVIKMGKTTVVVINDKNLEPSATNPNPKPGASYGDAYVAYVDEVTGTGGTTNMRKLLDQYGTVRVLADGVDFTGAIYIPAGTTLIIEDNVNLTGKNLNIGNNGTLVAEQTLTLVNHPIAAGRTVVAGAMVVNNSSTVTYAGNVQVVGNEEEGLAGDMSVAANATFDGDVDVDGELTIANTAIVTVTGTTTVGSLASSGGTNGTIVVKNANSLHVTGEANSVKIVTGDGQDSTKNGRVVIGKLGGLAVFEDNNIAASATSKTPVQQITEILGELKLIATSRLETAKFKPAKLSAEKNAEITLTEGIKSGTNGTIEIGLTDENGQVVPNTDEPTTIVIGETVTDKTASDTIQVGADDVSTDAYEAEVVIASESYYGTVAETIAKVNQVYATSPDATVYTINLQKDTSTNDLSTETSVVNAKVNINAGTYAVDLQNVTVAGQLSISALNSGSKLNVASGTVTITGTVASDAEITGNGTVVIGKATATLDQRYNTEYGYEAAGITMSNGTDGYTISATTQKMADFAKTYINAKGTGTGIGWAADNHAANGDWLGLLRGASNFTQINAGFTVNSPMVNGSSAASVTVTRDTTVNGKADADATTISAPAYKDANDGDAARIHLYLGLGQLCSDANGTEVRDNVANNTIKSVKAADGRANGVFEYVITWQYQDAEGNNTISVVQTLVVKTAVSGNTVSTVSTTGTAQ